jgi:hypothetical protein
MPHTLFNPAFVTAFTAAAAFVGAGNAAGVVVIVSQQRTLLATATYSGPDGPVTETTQAAAPDAGLWVNSISAGDGGASRNGTASQTSASRTDAPAGGLHVSAMLAATAFRRAPSPSAGGESFLRLVFDVVDEPVDIPFAVTFDHTMTLRGDTVRASLTGPNGPVLDWMRVLSTNTFPASPYSGVLDEGRYTLTLRISSYASNGEQFIGRSNLNWSMVVTPAPGAGSALVMTVFAVSAKRRRR